MTPKKINTFTFFKLPAAWWCGVRVKNIAENSCVTSVKHRWINQNPFNSMYFAVQAMAAELSTGALVMSRIKASGKPISMLVFQNKSSFSKKARGRITFTCEDGAALNAAIEQTLIDKEGKTIWMRARGVDEAGDEVSNFEFEWTVRAK